jgi:tetratricopeptide (TPR) repeat protein
VIGKLIREKSEGHPFFAEELAYALRDSGILLIENQECRLDPRFIRFEDLALPDTLQAAITNRIDSLNPSQQLTLKVASVIGRIFAFRVLQAIHPIEADKAALAQCMETLTRLSLTLIDSEGPELAYIFKHAVTQEVAYNLMLFSQRRRLHQAVAEWLEKNYENNLEAYYILLAHHWSQAAETTESLQDLHALQKAVDYLDRAGEQAMQNYANQEAIQFFSQALELDERVPSPEVGRVAHERQLRRARWHSRIGLAHYGLGSLPDCEKHIREALHILGYPIPKSRTQLALGIVPEIARQVVHRYFPSRYIGSLKGPEREVALEISRLFELIGRIYFYSQETLPIVYCILRFVNMAERAGPSAELASSYSGMAVMAGFAQFHSLADIYVDRALAIAEEVNQPSNLITVQVVTSVYQISVGKWEEIRARAERARLLCEQIGDYRQWGDSIEVLAESALISGDIDYALNLLNRLLEDARQRHNPLQMSWGLFGVAAINIRRGDEANAVPMLQEALQILEELPNLASSIDTNGQLALAYLRLGRKQDAIAYANKVLDMAAKISPTVYSMDIGFSAVSQVYFELWEQAVHDQSPDADELKQLSEKAINLLRAFQKVFPIGQPYAHYYQGWYEELSGKAQSAIKSWRTGLETAQKFRLQYEEALIRIKLGCYLQDDPEMRRKHFERAIQILERMGAVHELGMAKDAQKRWSPTTLPAPA